MCKKEKDSQKLTLNPHYYLQQGTASFDDKEYKSLLFNRF